MAKHTGIYRVRRGWFGKAILQECIDRPSIIGGRPDSSIRVLEWHDVPYNAAPRALVSQFCDDMVNKLTDGLGCRRSTRKE